MSEETARIVLIAITVCGAVFWAVTAWSFAGFVRAGRPEETPPMAGGWSKGVEGPVGDDVLSGHVEVEGRPAELSLRLAESLGRTGLAGMLVQVLERTDHRVVFDVSPIGVPKAAASGLPGRSSRGEARLKEFGGGRTQIDYALAAGRGSWLAVVGWVFVLLGLLALVGGYLLLDTLVVRNPNPGVRGQVAQMVQCIHLLWPPWLFGLLHRQVRTIQRTALEVLLSNLPYV